MPKNRSQSSRNERGNVKMLTLRYTQKHHTRILWNGAGTYKWNPIALLLENLDQEMMKEYTNYLNSPSTNKRLNGLYLELTESNTTER